jgi:CHASE2 domain-containing sensor protein
MMFFSFRMKAPICFFVILILSCSSKRTTESLVVTHTAYYPSDIILINVGEAGRCEIASMLRAIKQGNPRAIGLDLLFTERRKLECDTMLINALTSSQGIIIKGYSGTRITEPWPEFSDAALLVGITGLLMDTADFSDYHYRLMSETGRWTLSFPILLAMEFDKEKTLMSVSDVSPKPYPTFLKFRRGDFHVVSREKAATIEASNYKDKLVIIGYLGPLNDDLHKLHDINGNVVEEYSAVIFANIILDVVNRFATER